MTVEGDGAAHDSLHNREMGLPWTRGTGIIIVRVSITDPVAGGLDRRVKVSKK